jgi:hypothetical protein
VRTACQEAGPRDGMYAGQVGWGGQACCGSLECQASSPVGSPGTRKRKAAESVEGGTRAGGLSHKLQPSAVAL